MRGLSLTTDTYVSYCISSDNVPLTYEIKQVVHVFWLISLQPDESFAVPMGYPFLYDTHPLLDLTQYRS